MEKAVLSPSGCRSGEGPAARSQAMRATRLGERTLLRPRVAGQGSSWSRGGGTGHHLSSHQHSPGPSTAAAVTRGALVTHLCQPCLLPRNNQGCLLLLLSLLLSLLLLLLYLLLGVPAHD
ncbi:MAG: hypothetical protein WDW38_008873 [Sanguina aurantia]